MTTTEWLFTLQPLNKRPLQEEHTMPITITITDPTPAQIAALFGGQGVVAVEATPEKPKREAKPKAEPVAEDQPVEATNAEPDTPAEASLDDVKAAAQALVKANGREALAELLAEFKAENLSGVPAGKRAAFIAAAEKKIA